MAREIPLTQGKVAIVDDADYEWLNQWRWQYLRPSYPGSTGYAIRSDYTSGKRVFILMHRLILDAPQGAYVDHRDHDGLNNQRCNLRIATPSQNHYNLRPTSSPTTSKYKGVCYVTGKQKWIAKIQSEKHHRFLGYFDTELEAAHAYNNAAQQLHGDFALQNDISNHTEQDLPVKRKRKQSSIYKGVSFDSRQKAWCAYAMINYKKKHLGHFESEKDAALAYDAFVKSKNLNRPLNFPVST